jgi:hypothetical protein
MNRIRTGKTKSPTKHLGKGVGSSRKRNLKRIANKQERQRAKREIK